MKNNVKRPASKIFSIITIAFLSQVFFLAEINAVNPCLEWQEYNTLDWKCYCPDWSIDEYRFWCITKLNEVWDKDIADSVEKMWNFLRFLIIPLSIIVLTYWWMKYATAMWDDLQIKKAKKIIFVAISWIALYLFYYLFADFIYQIFT